MTEVFFRNPSNFIRELAECGEGNVAWDRGMLEKRRIDPIKHAELYFGDQTPWRVWMIGTQGTMELRKDYTPSNPFAVYPTWESTEGLEVLEDFMASPVGENKEYCTDSSIPVDERPVYGQPHVVLVTNLPHSSQGPGRALIRKLKELQEEYPDCILHIHGSYSWRVMFGSGFGSVDIDPRTDASKGDVTLPSGKRMKYEKTIGCPQWVSLLGYTVRDLADPRTRCMFNIKSARWASEHFMENIKFKVEGEFQPDSHAANPKPATSQSHLTVFSKAQVGDKIQCDVCSLQNSCKYYRQGSVCSVPGSEPARLAAHFKTRDADLIIDGLGTLVAAGANRLERGMSEEAEYGEMDPEVTKMMNTVFNQGVQLAKLLDPNLRGGGTKVQVNVGNPNGNAAAVAAASPNQLMGAVVRELESRGIPRAEQTQEMVMDLVAAMGRGESQPQAIEGVVVARSDD